MMVVLSLSMMTFLAVPRSTTVTDSSFLPRSSEMTWPPVRMAMSSSMALRLSPKPGALTAAHLSVPLSLFTTRVARASPSMSSEMISRALPSLAICSRTGMMSLMLLIFLS